MGTFFPSPLPSKPHWPQDGLAGADAAPLQYSKSVRHPFHAYRLFDCGFGLANLAALELTASRAIAQASSTALVPMSVVLCPIARFNVDRLNLELQPIFEPIEIIDEEIPPFAGLVVLARPVVQEALRAAVFAMPLEIPNRARLPLDQAAFRFAWAPAELLPAGLRPLATRDIPPAHVPSTDTLRAFDLRTATGAPSLNLLTPALQPRLRLAPGRRYAVSTWESVATPIAPATQTFAPELPPIAWPPRAVRVLRGAQSARPAPLEEPNPAGLALLPMLAKMASAKIVMHPAPEALASVQMPRPAVIRPRARLEPLKPNFEAAGAPPPAAENRAPLRPFVPLVDFLHRAPRDLKLLAFAVPLLLALALHPRLPKVSVATPGKAAAIQRNFEKVWTQELVNVKQSVTERAAIALDEDFRAGLDDWVSRGDAPTAWSFDATGFVRPGPLALYRPTMTLGDYEMQFLGMIDKKALSWVARAADFNNFYVMKLMVLKDGPVPKIGLTRYAVVNGKADARVDTIAAIDARRDMLYRVRLDVHGDEFALTVQDQLIDAWSEPRLHRGGVGFFTARGEESRLRWVQVTHQYDMLGRLCAYLAPYNVASASTNGSMEQ